MSKERLDVLLVKKGFFNSREKARSSIMAGVVYVNNVKADKPGMKYNDTDDIVIKENINPFVSRGGLKLQKALSYFGINLEGKIALDIGASTGGFTDCMLKNGAAKVYAIDVGYGQLAWELRNDDRVVCMERTNIRYVKPEDIGEAASFASIDVSFISLKKVLPVVSKLLSEDGEIICLVKPQFEAGREKVGKHGVVKDKETHVQVLKEILLFSRSTGFGVKGLTYSPIRGPEGNIEFLLYLTKNNIYTEDHELDMLIKAVVEESHNLSE
ncbi:MAG TPA: TlyA family RNA methyltransferase [Clostridiaceae bacterium]|nr:TlyA family RNA methyltransferase [Clostridiaceae bacterium]